MGHARQPEDVDVELPPPFSQGHFLQRSVGTVAGVVDQHVDPAVGRDDHGHRGRHRFLGGDVQRQDGHAGCFSGSILLHTAGSGVHRKAGRSELNGSLETDAGGRTGDKRDWRVT